MKDVLDYHKVPESWPDAIDSLVDSMAESTGKDFHDCEALIAFDCVFSTDESGRLYCEEGTPSDPIVWIENIGWVVADGEEDTEDRQVVIPAEGR